MKKIVFSDLDGTLLEHKTYSFKEALPAIKKLKKKRIPIIFCTSKTRAETEFLQKKLLIKGPFIVENGSAVFIPKKFFSFSFPFTKKTKTHLIIELAVPLKKILPKFKKLKKKFRLKCFHGMSAKRVSLITGLPVSIAALAKKREYDEPFLLKNPLREKELFREMKKLKLEYTKGGRFYHLLKGTDKGKAVKKLIELYKKQFKEVVSYSIGDSQNDFEMLKQTDYSFLVQRKDKSYASEEFSKAHGIGPKGWSKAMGKV